MPAFSSFSGRPGPLVVRDIYYVHGSI